MSNEKRLLVLTLILCLAGTILFSLVLAACSFAVDKRDYDYNRTYTISTQKNSEGIYKRVYDTKLMDWDTYHPKNHPWALTGGGLIGILFSTSIIMSLGLYKKKTIEITEARVI